MIMILLVLRSLILLLTILILSVLVLAHSDFADFGFAKLVVASVYRFSLPRLFPYDFLKDSISISLRFP